MGRCGVGSLCGPRRTCLKLHVVPGVRSNWVYAAHARYARSSISFSLGEHLLCARGLDVRFRLLGTCYRHVDPRGISAFVLNLLKERNIGLGLPRMQRACSDVWFAFSALSLEANVESGRQWQCNVSAENESVALALRSGDTRRSGRRVVVAAVARIRRRLTY